MAKMDNAFFTLLLDDPKKNAELFEQTRIVTCSSRVMHKENGAATLPSPFNS